MDGRQWLFVLGSLLLVLFVCFNSFQAANLLRRGDLAFNPLLHPLEVAGRFGFVGACVVLGLISGLPLERFGWVETEPLRNTLIGLGAAAVLQALNHYGARWALRRWGRGVYSPAILRAMLPRGRREWALAVVALLPAALAEEVLFRGLVIGGFSTFVSPWLLSVLFAAVFGLAHLPQGKLGVIGAGVLGFGLNLLFLWRWSLLACTVAHYGVNLAQLVWARSELRWLEEE